MSNYIYILIFSSRERDCTIAFGASMVLNMRMLTLSDPYTAYYCECGYMAYKNMKDRIYYCPKCIKGKTIYKVLVPYVWKLVNQELASMGIKTRIKISEFTEYNECISTKTKTSTTNIFDFQ